MTAFDPPRILLVEDAPEIRLLLSSGLTQAGYRVVQAKMVKKGWIYGSLSSPTWC